MEKNKKILKKIKEKLKLNKNKDIHFNLLEVIIIIIITGVFVSIASGLIVYGSCSKLNNDTSKPVYLNEELKDFKESYNHIINSYVEEVNKKELINAAIEGMYNYLGDDYSSYLDEDTTNSLNEQLQGEYTGLGVEISTYLSGEKYLNVINRVFKDSQAEKAGLQKGDILLQLDEHDLTKTDAEFISNTIKYGTKESFTLKYDREGKENTVTIKRGYVFINSVETKEYDEVGYIKLETFSSTTTDQVKNAINTFSDKITSIIIDVRDNTGGYLTTAHNTADLLLEKGKVIYQIKDKNEKITKYKAGNGKIRNFDKIVVLINNSSASASEILALALKESANAIIVGQTSFGKGTVQETSKLSSGSMVKFTTSYWLSPNGNSINKIGIKPDVEVKGVDEQLKKALEVIRK